MTDSDYEYYTVHTDSIHSGSSSEFVNHLSRPIKDIVEVSVLNCSLDVQTSNVVYVKSDEFTSHFNINTLTSDLEYSPVGKAKTEGSILRLNTNLSGRTVYNQYDYDSLVRFITPIRKLDRITVRLYDENGASVTPVSNVFMSFKLKCKRENLSI